MQRAAGTFPIAYGDEILALVHELHAGSERLPGYDGWIRDHMGGRVVAFRDRLLPQIRAFTDLENLDVLDFGCGTGTSAPHFIAELNVQVTGVDVSRALLEQARREHSSSGVRYLLQSDYQPSGDVDIAFCNGVFHHIPPGERPAALDYVRRSLRPGGLFAFWENNPWNPGTRFVMSRIPFDRDAITISPPEARRSLAFCTTAPEATSYPLFCLPARFSLRRS